MNSYLLIGRSLFIIGGVDKKKTVLAFSTIGSRLSALVAIFLLLALKQSHYSLRQSKGK